MLKYRTMDLMAVDKGIILHGCNVQSAYNSGVAGAIRKKFPAAYHSYIATIESAETRYDLLGTVDFYPVSDILYIGNAFTQQFYGFDKNKRYASPEYIDKCLKATVEFAKEVNLPVFIPKIGCGLGGLTWETDVLEYVESAAAKLQHYKLDLTVCEL